MAAIVLLLGSFLPCIHAFAGVLGVSSPPQRPCNPSVLGVERSYHSGLSGCKVPQERAIGWPAGKREKRVLMGTEEVCVRERSSRRTDDVRSSVHFLRHSLLTIFAALGCENSVHVLPDGEVITHTGTDGRAVYANLYWLLHHAMEATHPSGI